MKLRIGFSPCPNDTYIFDSLINNRIQSGLPPFEYEVMDVEQLNNLAFNSYFDMTKLSFAAYGHVSGKYILIPYGAALGYSNGPVLVSKKKIYPDEVPFLKIATPGKYTTAVLLLNIFFEGNIKQKEYLFSDIEDVVISGEADAGLIIHESRFTYQRKGLRKICDMGEMWEARTRLPLPLGGIAVKRNLGDIVIKQLASAVRQSLNYANLYPCASENFVKKHATETRPEITKQHISLFVNEFSLNLSQTGEKAINTLLKDGVEKKLIPPLKQPVIFKG